MENKPIARTLRLLSQLMELHDENAFKAKSLAAAAFKIDKLPYPIAGKSLAELEQVDGIGKSTAAKVWSLVHENTIPELSALLEKTPAGIVEMMRIKGLGPKKISILWKSLGIETVGELYYACNENRLIEAKGFGLKTQDEIRKTIEFAMASSGRSLYAQIEEYAEQLLTALKEALGTDQCYLTGQFRRRCEVLDSLDILAVAVPGQDIAEKVRSAGLQQIGAEPGQLRFDSGQGIKVNLLLCDDAALGWQMIRTNGNDDHAGKLGLMLIDQDVTGKSEQEIYSLAGLPYIEPELRECVFEFELAQQDRLPVLLESGDLKGTLHNHSTWSDGIHSIEEMALYCRDTLKLSYLGICDHSRSAFYANGLDEIRVAAQQREIDLLNTQLSPFMIFKGIESDILYDGSLDYPDEVLSSFDFVVASIHSVLKMPEEKATSRLIRAIENPYTTILGHPTGRMLLTRSGYPIDHAKVIDACAANHVIIEINSNPLRLDIDWRWHQYAISKGVLLSVNPDAHRKERFHDMHYGTLVARKGGVARENCLNTLEATEVAGIFRKKKQQI